jgi:hypothetical protein
VDIVCSIDLAGFVNFRICCECLFDKITHLLFVVGVPFDSFYDQAMRGAPRLLG